MTKEINVRFLGYYESEYNDLIDNQIESESIDPDKLNYKATTENLNHIYIDCFKDHFNETFKLNVDLKYKYMTSPREYNFTTDRLSCDISKKDIKKLYDFALKDLRSFRMVLNERFTPVSGFIPFYSNDINTWLENPLKDWDSVELETLLEVVIFSEYQEDCEQSFNNEVFELVQEKAIYNGYLNIVTI